MDQGHRPPTPRLALRTASAFALLLAAAGCQPPVGEPSPAPDTTVEEQAALDLSRAGLTVAEGADFSCGLLTGGIVKCWGANASGQLGDGDTVTRGNGARQMGWDLPAVNLGTGAHATAIAVGFSHACALLESGQVKCWGANTFGQLGVGDKLARGDGAGEMGDALAAVKLGAARFAKSISTGSYHSCALLDNGQTKCWGDNAEGQLGLGDKNNRGDNAGEMGDSLPAIALGTGRSARTIAAGPHHTCALLDDGRLKCWGQNSFGQLGLGDLVFRGDNAGEMGDALPAVDVGTGRLAQAVALGNHHTCALLDSGATKCWGSGADGALGLGDTTTRGDNAGEMGDALPAVDLGAGRHATALGAGYLHSCALLDNGQLKCWGTSTYGQVGLGDTLIRGTAAGQMGDALPAVSVGTGRTAARLGVGVYTTCVALDNRQVKCWGRNNGGQLGLGNAANRGDNANEMGDLLPPVLLGTGPKLVAAGPLHTCAILDTDDVKCWGSNWAGQLGVGDTAPRGDNAGEMGDTLPTVALGFGRHAKALAVGFEHTCALLDNDQVKCWGGNSYGQLGVGDVIGRGDQPNELGDALPAVSLGTGRTARSLAAGDYHTCALLDNGLTKCWGHNVYGQLGLGDNNDRGDGPGEMGDTLPAVNLGSGRSAKLLAAGSAHSCAILDDATLKCWGGNGYGQLGYGDQVIRGKLPSDMGDSLPVVSLGTGRTAKGLGLGVAHSCAILDDATLKCWGKNDNGQLGLGDTVTRGWAANQMGDNLPLVTLGTGRTVRSVSAGTAFSCASLDSNSVKCWGDSTYGQLGYGTTNARGDGPNEMGTSLPAVNVGTGRFALTVSTGEDHACALLDDGEVKCWGWAGFAQLGLGDLNNRGDNSGEMGANLPAVNLGAGVLTSTFFKTDPGALQIVAGTPYNIDDPAWPPEGITNYNRDVFAWKLISAFQMIGMNPFITYINGNNYTRFQVPMLNKFQARYGFPVESLVRLEVLQALDALVAAREATFRAHGLEFLLYDHMQPLHPNDISKDTLATMYGHALKVLPAALQMGLYESVQCIDGQCLGFIQDASGNQWPTYPVDLNADYRFVGAYFDPHGPFNVNAVPSLSADVGTVLHEFAHYIDNYDGTFAHDPNLPVRVSVLTTSFADISYDMSQRVQGDCAPPRSSDPHDWVTAYGFSSNYGCPTGYKVILEEFAEAFSMYVSAGRHFRAAAAKNAKIAAKYAWLKTNVFGNVEYDTDLVRGVESGCNDTVGFESQLPGYASCNPDYVWDGELRTLQP